MAEVKNKDLLYPDLSYEIVGILFDVWKEVGWGHKEFIYQKAIEVALKEKGIQFSAQLPSGIDLHGIKVGLYRFDFLVEKKVVLEIKVRNYFSKRDIDQIYSYLKSSGLQLGIIAHFTKEGVKFKRVVNLT